MKTDIVFAHTMTQISELLVHATGVDPHSLDVSRLRWVIESRCRHSQLDDPTAYVERVMSSSDELDALIDAFVVQETRFFRDSRVFKHLRQWLPRMATDFPGALRILSAPCSTGQEAYSIAALLQESGIPLARFTVDAIDISVAALEVARRGVYPGASMRDVSLDLQQACGVIEAEQWKMHNALKGRIRFHRKNLAEPGALDTQQLEIGGKYHLILCRNLFIYICPQARAMLAQSLASALLPGGHLVIGSADGVEELNALFVPQGPAAAFAYMHRPANAPVFVRSNAPVESNPAASRIARAAQLPRRTEAVTPAAQTLSGTAADRVPSSAASFYHSALQHHHHGNHRKAERHCRQALYLDPKHLPALELLAKLWLQYPNLRLRRALEARIHRNRLASGVVSPFNSASGYWTEEPRAARKENA